MTWEDWADRMYKPGAQVSHVVESERSMCETDPPLYWLGTGSMDEYDHAKTLPLCGQCQSRVGGS